MIATIYLIGGLDNKLLESQAIEYISRFKQLSKIKLQTKTIKDKTPGEKLDARAILDELDLTAHDTFILSEHGKEFSSREFAQKVAQFHNYGNNLNFVLGNAAGWQQQNLNTIQTLSLSRMTFNHEIAYLMLTEQLYRYADCISGSRYAK